MLPLKHRLPLRKKFLDLRSSGKFVHGKFFDMIMDDGNVLRATESQFAFVVSKKVSKKAVLRNRVKRLLSEAVLSSIPKLKKKISCAFLAKESAIDATLPQLVDEIETSFKKLGLL